MKRRGFLGLFGKAAAAVVAAPVLAKVPASDVFDQIVELDKDLPYEHVKYGLGFKVDKYDDIANKRLNALAKSMQETKERVASGVITTGNHPKTIWPGIDKFFNESYAKHESEFTDLFK